MASPIKFGTDGWRGLIAEDFTCDRLAEVAPVAAQVLSQLDTTGTRKIIVGYDRRFMAEEFARVTAESVCNFGFDVDLADTYAPTPAFSWIAHDQKALGALVITASHNPGGYSGLKVKGGFGGSVSPEVTQKIEALLATPASFPATEPGRLQSINPWQTGYCEALTAHVDLEIIRAAIAAGRLTVFVDVMHGATAGGMETLLGVPIHELNSHRDPLFGGGAPEPLPKYLSYLCRQIRTHQHHHPQGLAVGLVFDGDGDRIAAVDSQGNFLSSQILIPILIEHLVTRRGMGGEIIKTVSGSDLIPRIAELYQLPLFETPIGYKYIADRMLTSPVLLGGEESGGIGYGHHIPERDALLSALYLLEAIAQSGEDLGQLYQNLQAQTHFSSAYDRIDLPLANMTVRSQLLQKLQTQPLTTLAGQAVTDCLTIDGFKFRLLDGSWLMIRFSGTEPVLRLYCEAATLEQVHQLLNWAKDWATCG
ncbi:phosphoglucosamine mutase [Neosynechococcus sphagnicola sy1]|uniref:phosphoglucomutase (alpha-D-glucose-1,6-bisphosphate-dependent) n=1 Tax=Neosynechococcus sphagnicola sy1 TaxID=1497020 RepID=A0A098TM33_9CYAN|nr:phosphoglucomutase/phosphomannomutase family protein [Neosynechococcus sphagnicola]KGF71898.1 phosphoglucosamine mutase [Neosynechococcus sphagnicola sy1]